MAYSFEEDQKRRSWTMDDWINEAKRNNPNLDSTGAFYEAFNKKQAFDNSSPARPDYISTVDPATGKLKENYQLGQSESLYGMLPSIYNEEALNKLRGIALSDDTSPYAKLLLDQQKLEEAQQKENVGRQAKTAAGDAWSQLAMRGGVSGGERERIAYQGARDVAGANAGVNMAGAQQRLGILSNDAAQRLGLLQAMPGLEAGRADIYGKAKQADISNKRSTDMFNIGNLIQDTQGKNAFNTGNYQEAMKTWAAGKQAEAEKNAGGGISYLCTAVNKISPLSDVEWGYLNQIKACSEQYPEAHKFYFQGCEDLIPIMKEHGVNFREYIPFVKTVIAYCREFGAEFAFDFYAEYLGHVVEQYAPEKVAAYKQAYYSINR